MEFDPNEYMVETRVRRSDLHFDKKKWMYFSTRYSEKYRGRITRYFSKEDRDYIVNEAKFDKSFWGYATPVKVTFHAC